METINHIFCTVMLTVFLGSLAHAQENTDADQLDQQFEKLKSNSNSVQSGSGREYKVMNLQSLNSLWNDVQELMAASSEELEQTKSKVNALNEEVANLSQRVEAQQASIQESDFAVTHLSVLGNDISKSKFVATFWIVIGVLIVLLVVAVYQYKLTRDTTRRTQINFMQLQEEMEELRKTSLEKERRLRRELQTERNMIEEMGRNPGYKR